MWNILTMEIVATLFVIVKIAALSFLCASFIFTLEVAKSEGMILEKFAKYLDGKFWLKPFGGCGYCTLFWVALLSGLYQFGFIGISCAFVSFVIYKKI